MSDNTLNWIANFIWGIADDVLRDVYVRGKYRDVILPMVVIRRLDAVLDPTKQAVLNMKKLLEVLDGAKPANTAAVRVNAVPGVQHRYSGGGTSVVQQMLIDLLGKPFPELMRELVLDPLGMTQSTYEQPLPEARWADAATAHPQNGKPLEGKWHTYPEVAAAGLWTTAEDLARFAIELQFVCAGLPDRLLSAGIAEQMFVRHSGEPVGLGLFLEGEGASARFGHNGWDEGFVARMTAYQEGGCGAVVMLNSNQGLPLMEEILRAIAAEYDWPGYLPVPRAPVVVDASVLDTYAGEYELRPGFTLTVARCDDGLAVQPTGQAPISFYAESETRYFAKVVEAEVTFVRREGEKAADLVFRQNGREMAGKRLR